MKTNHKNKINSEPKKSKWFRLSSLEWLLIVATFVLYGNTLFHDYTLDDSMVITNNAFTKEGFSGLPKLFANDTFLGFSKEMLGDTETKNLVQGGRYRPLSLATFAIEWQLFGKNPTISHLLNILLYAFTVVLLYRLLNLFFVTPKSLNYLENIPLLASLLFLLHPLHTEVVANIKGRDELMAFFFALLAWYYSIIYRGEFYFKRTIKIYVFLFLALLSKESAIAFVLVIPLSIFFFYKEEFTKNLKLFAGLVLITLLFIAIRQVIVLPPSESSIGGLMNNPFQHVKFSNRLATALYTLTNYYKLLVVPHPLTYDYYPNHILIQHFSSIGTIVGIVLSLGFLLIAFYFLKRNRIVSFFIFFFFITFFLLSNIPVNIGVLMAERFLYVPSLGFAVLFAVCTVYFFRKKNMSSMVKYSFFTICVLFSLKTIARNSNWKNNKMLFEADVKTSFNSAHVNKNLGEVYLTEATKEKDPLQKKLLHQKSEAYLLKACGIYPDYYDAWVSLGNNYFYQSNYTKAIQCYHISIKLNPEKSVRLYRAIADIYGLNLGNYPMSITYMKKALKLEKNKVELLTNISIAYYRLKDYKNAIIYTKKILQIEPSSKETATNLATFETEYKNAQKYK